MPESNQPSLFDQFPETTPPVEPVSSPSEQFRRDNPDFVEPQVVRSERDPNARRAEQLRGVGGGFASAVAGEISVEPVEADGNEIITNQEPTDKTPTNQEVAEESLADQEPIPETPVSVTLSVPVSLSPRRDRESSAPAKPEESEREKAMRLARELAERNATKEPLFPGAVPRDVAEKRFYENYWAKQARKQK